MSKIICKIHHVDNGFCRINYTAKNSSDQTIHYCLQDEGERYGGVTMYRSTRDWEPDCQVKSKKEIWEVPTGNSEIEIDVRKFLTGEII